MRKLAFTLSVAVALVVAGCSSEEVALDASPTGVKPEAGAGQAIRSLAMQRRQKNPFASLPDRGALLAYDRSRVTANRGVETYYPVQLSEAHALNAAAPGRNIALQTPSGTNLSFAYQRMEEGLDGNWTWIGRTRDGLEAIITFGEDAVFGRIEQQGAQALQITMSAGQPWLVQGDRNRMFDGNLLRGGDRDDMLIPRDLAVAAAARKQTAAAAASPSAAGGSKAGEVGTKASAANTVDVVLGFTNGLVARFGSAAAVNTRLTNLIAITNQAYQNSLVTPRVRLVRTVQVAYTDTNDHEVALEALTGFTCTTSGCTAQAVPAELVPLRTARDQYGGDLVSLVRQLRAPEQNGCGVAWLLGGGGFSIDSTDAPFGYSVIADGTDVSETDGRTYFCYDISLAHELGHNMGQQHNVEDSDGNSGMHSYSYGYRESSTTGFFTAMAYEIDNASQFSITHFGNPNVTYANTGRATGTATADNARSLNIAMPLVAQFRNVVVPLGGSARNDFNGDGRSDIVLWNSSISYLAYWVMNGSVYTGSGGFGVASGFSPSATGFLSPIPQTSLLARNTTTQTLYSYIWNGTTHAQGAVGGTPAGWNLIGTGDIDGDGRGDLLWRNPTTGQFAYWLMNGAVYLGGQTYGPPATYVVAGIADFNGDGRTDLLWNDPGTRNASIWMSTGNGFSVSLIGQYGSDWNMIGTADVTGDGKADILLRDNAKIYLAYWRMDGAVYQGSSAFGLASNRDLFTTGDFDGDGIEDLVINRPSDRNLYLWRSNGTAFTENVIGQYGAEWAVIK